MAGSWDPDGTGDAALRSWVDGADESGFGVQHLPYGVVSPRGGPPGVGVAIGDFVLDLAAVAADGGFAGVVDDASRLFAVDRLNPLLAAGPDLWRRLRQRISLLLRRDTPRRERASSEALYSRGDVTLHLPFEVADYVDFFSSIEHASNAGRLFRPDADPLPPNWRFLPVAYHGRAGTVVVSGTSVVRPTGQHPPAERGGSPGFGPSNQLDVELEVGFVTGPPSRRGHPVPVSATAEHVFGVVLVNDWSARDLQVWEARPLGPFLGKSFATSIGAWVTPLAALQPFRAPQRKQDPPVHDYLRVDEPWALDLSLEIGLRSAAMAAAGEPFALISASNFSGMYWTIPQQLAHATINGASLRTGDLFASGTVSGAEHGSEGSLLELTRGGRDPLTLPDGSRRGFLEDGDEVVLRASAGGDGRPRLTLGEVRGAVTPAVALA